MKQVNTEAVKSIKEQTTVFYMTFLNLVLTITILMYHIYSSPKNVVSMVILTIIV